MFDKILVPLDGSELAECALSYAQELALKCKSQMLALVSVTERVTGKVRFEEARQAYERNQRDDITDLKDEIRGEYILSGTGGTILNAPGPDRLDSISVTVGKLERQAEKYLQRLAAKVESAGIPVHTQVLFGNVAESITAFAQDYGFDTIVMSTHGRSGPSRWAWGSVADRVFRASSIPVLLIRAPVCSAAGLGVRDGKKR